MKTTRPLSKCRARTRVTIALIITAIECTTAEDDLVAVAARRRQPQPRFGVCWPHNGDYPDPGRISMIKRASAARKVATSEGSRPGAAACSLTLRALWPGSAGPAHQRRREGAVSTATGGISGELCSCVDHHRDGDGAAAATREAFDQREGVRALPRTRQDLSGAVQDVSWSRLHGCRLRAEPGRRRGRGGRRAGTADPGRGGRSAVSWSRLV